MVLSAQGAQKISAPDGSQHARHRRGQINSKRVIRGRNSIFFSKAKNMPLLGLAGLFVVGSASQNTLGAIELFPEDHSRQVMGQCEFSK